VKRLVGWFVENPVAVNLITAFVLVSGILGAAQMRREVFPAVAMRWVQVTVIYPGAGPADVEQAVVLRVEEAIHDVAGIERLRSTAFEGLARITAEVENQADLREVMATIKARVDAIHTFPVDVERPLISRPTHEFGVLHIGLAGEIDEPTLAHWGSVVRDGVAALSGVSKVELYPRRDPQVVIEVSEDALRRHNLTFDALVAAVRVSSLDLPAGSIEGAQGGRLRVSAQAYNASDFAALPLVVRADGTRLVVGDVANVVDTVNTEDAVVRVDGQRGAMIEVLRTGEQDALVMAERSFSGPRRGGRRLLAKTHRVPRLQP
jgi:multidrug efflux pump subunit AcrB